MVLSVKQSGIPCFLIIVAARGNNNVALIWTVLGMYFILIFSMVSQLHFNVSVCHLCRIPCFVCLLLLQGLLPSVVRLIRVITMRLLYGLLEISCSYGGGVFRSLRTKIGKGRPVLAA